MTIPSDFPWRSGMLDATSGDRMFNDEVILRVDGIDSGCEALTDTARPDLTDPATLGALLGAVREAYARPTAYAKPYDGGWAVVGVPDPHGEGLAAMLAPLLGQGKTEAAALLSAWAKRPTVPR